MTRKECFILKEISKADIKKLLEFGIIQNTNKGYVNKSGNRIGYYKTKGAAHKRYIQDWYANKAATL